MKRGKDIFLAFVIITFLAWVKENIILFCRWLNWVNFRTKAQIYRCGFCSLNVIVDVVAYVYTLTVHYECRLPHPHIITIMNFSFFFCYWWWWWLLYKRSILFSLHTGCVYKAYHYHRARENKDLHEQWIMKHFQRQFNSWSFTLKFIFFFFFFAACFKLKRFKKNL